jgi:hypothetical protein
MSEKGAKTCNGGQWTEARRSSFIKNALRAAHSKWGPACRAKQAARTRRGFYRCAACGEEVPSTIPAVYKSGKKAGKAYRKKNALMDHRDPVVDPKVGFVDWDTYIERMFVEQDAYDCLCDACHSSKTAEERAIRTEVKRKARR